MDIFVQDARAWMFDTIIDLLRTHIFVRAHIPERENVCGVQVQV